MVCNKGHSYCVENLTFIGDNKCPQCREDFLPQVTENMRERRTQKRKEESERRELERERDSLKRTLDREIGRESRKYFESESKKPSNFSNFVSLD